MSSISNYLSSQIPASSGPGINRNRLCSFNREWAAIICPSLPNCNLHIDVSNNFILHNNKISFFWIKNIDNVARISSNYNDISNNVILIQALLYCCRHLVITDNEWRIKIVMGVGITWGSNKNEMKGYMGENRNFPWKQIRKEQLPHSQNHPEQSVAFPKPFLRKKHN